MSSKVLCDGLKFISPNILKQEESGETIQLDIPLLKKILFKHSRLAIRLFRMEPRCAVPISAPYKYIISTNTGINIVNFSTKHVSLLTKSRDGFSAVLNFCNSPYGILWGDYGNNPHRESVNIYIYNENNGMSVAYRFPESSIRHVHNIVYDTIRDGFWILTGDCEEHAGIYFADKEFKSMNPILIGAQQYRAVIAFPTSEGLIYATDAVDETNYIYTIKYNNSQVSLNRLFQIAGSCIYGIQTDEYYVFSTTVEPPEGRGFFNLFTYKLGRGIRDRYSDIISVRKSDLKIKQIAKFKKDIWPMKLFQYGSVQFANSNVTNEIICNAIACKKVDGKPFRITL